MNVAVVTPYYKETTDILKRCHNSVIDQTYPVTHIMVADGNPHPWCVKQQVEHIVLPKPHKDAGATPRALGALSAFSRGYDAVAFLDADNWYEPNHIDIMVKIMTNNQVDAVMATRTIYAMDCTPMYVDKIESTGETFIDTNCWFLGKKTAMLMSYWVTDPSNHLVSDKVFFHFIKQAGIKIFCSEQPTVAYVSNWGWHYKQAGLPIPPDAVWMSLDQNGSYIQIKEKDKGDKI